MTRAKIIQGQHVNRLLCLSGNYVFLLGAFIRNSQENVAFSAVASVERMRKTQSLHSASWRILSIVDDNAISTIFRKSIFSTLLQLEKRLFKQRSLQEIWNETTTDEILSRHSGAEVRFACTHSFLSVSLIQ